MANSKWQIYIIGTGAIGKALAVFLQKEGRKVTLVRGSMDDGSCSMEEICVESEKNQCALIPIATLSTLETMEGIIVLATKSYGNERLAIALKAKRVPPPSFCFKTGST